MRLNTLYIILVLLLAVSGSAMAQVCDTVYTSIYPQTNKRQSKIYNWLWGKHYRTLYSTPVAMPSVSSGTLRESMRVVGRSENFHGFWMEGDQRRLYLLRPLGGTSLLQGSTFFREIYSKTDFKETYLNDFVDDTYTIINPYTFLVADYLAGCCGLGYTPSSLFYIPPQREREQVADMRAVQDKLVFMTLVPNPDTQMDIHPTEAFLDSLQVNKNYMADQDLYIRERIFGLWIGDWGRTTDRWYWQSCRMSDSLVFKPIVIDRSHAFTKADGVLFQQVLKMLSLDFIVDYDRDFSKGTKIVNKLGIALDRAVAGRSDEAVWMRQARFLQERLTDSLLDKAFTLLPVEVREDEVALIRQKMKQRKHSLDTVVGLYYRSLQRFPVVAGTNYADNFLIERLSSDSTVLKIYNPSTRQCVLERGFSKKTTKELWIYGLAGNDTFRVQGNSRKGFPIYLISGGGQDTFLLNRNRNIRVYDKRAYVYDYQKNKYHQTSFTPWGVYDSDNGISLGAFLTYTMYGFKRAPFTYQHRIGYNYLEGFVYQGVFPDFEGRKRLRVDASIASPRNFENFFGFGNNTANYEDKDKAYNRVKLRAYTVTPSFQVDLREGEMVSLFTTGEIYKAENSDNRFIQTVYGENHPFFQANYFVGLGTTYQISRRLSSLVPNMETSWTAGWKMNLRNPHRNYPYLTGNLSWDVRFTDRLTWASLLSGTLLFNNKYEFYQAATIDLRGFRDNRFIGKQSFYHQTDLRLDMGKLRNPLTPLKYGLFVGFDYGRVWFPKERSRVWHTSYGGGIWLTFLDKFVTKYAWFGSTDSFRFMLELGFGF